MIVKQSSTQLVIVCATAPALGGGELAQALLLVPLIRLVGDMAKMAGYPVGVWRRVRRESQHYL